jgi:L-aminopeptidase/D-esterase-like protein
MNDAITDVPGVRVGHCTVVRDPALMHAETTTGRNGRTVYAFRSE